MATTGINYANGTRAKFWPNLFGGGVLGGVGGVVWDPCTPPPPCLGRGGQIVKTSPIADTHCKCPINTPAHKSTGLS